MHEPWREPATPAEREARQEAYRRLASAARRAGLPVERLARMLREVEHNEVETRRTLREVYGVPDDLLDDLLRVRLEDLREDGPDAAGRGE